MNDGELRRRDLAGLIERCQHNLAHSAALRHASIERAMRSNAKDREHLALMRRGIAECRAALDAAN